MQCGGCLGHWKIPCFPIDNMHEGFCTEPHFDSGLQSNLSKNHHPQFSLTKKGSNHLDLTRTNLLLIILLVMACKEPPPDRDVFRKETARVFFHHLQQADSPYELIDIRMTSDDRTFETQLLRGEEANGVIVLPGHYQFKIDYTNHEGDIIISTAYCEQEDQEYQQITISSQKENYPSVLTCSPPDQLTEDPDEGQKKSAELDQKIENLEGHIENLQDKLSQSNRNNDNEASNLTEELEALRLELDRLKAEKKADELKRRIDERRRKEHQADQDETVGVAITPVVLEPKDP